MNNRKYNPRANYAPPISLRLTDEERKTNADLAAQYKLSEAAVARMAWTDGIGIAAQRLSISASSQSVGTSSGPASAGPASFSQA